MIYLFWSLNVILAMLIIASILGIIRIVLLFFDDSDINVIDFYKK